MSRYISCSQKPRQFIADLGQLMRDESSALARAAMDPTRLSRSRVIVRRHLSSDIMRLKDDMWSNDLSDPPNWTHSEASRTVYEIDHIFDLILEMVQCKKTLLGCMLLEKRSEWRAASVLWRERSYLSLIDQGLRGFKYYRAKIPFVSTTFRYDETGEI